MPNTLTTWAVNSYRYSEETLETTSMADLQQSVVDEFVFFQKAADDGLFRVVALIVS